MSDKVKATARHVRYKITSHPDGERTLSADCMGGDCRWSMVPTADIDAGQHAKQEHTARTGHAIFSRNLEDMAVVVLADKAERDRRAEVNALEYAHGGGAAEDREGDLHPSPEHARAAY